MPDRYCIGTEHHTACSMLPLTDIRGELERLNKELMFVYSELLRVLVENPTCYASPLNTLNQLLGNMQHLVNLMRPIQARALGEKGLPSMLALRRLPKRGRPPAL